MDRNLVPRVGAMAAMSGVVVTLVAFGTVFMGVLDPFAEVSSAEYMRGIEQHPTLWLSAHLLVCVGLALKLTGLVSIASRVGEVGDRLAARVGIALALVGGALLLATMAFDGYVHQYVAERWTTAPGADKGSWESIFAASLRGSYGLELTSLLLLLGFAPIALGLGLRSAGSTFPRWIATTAIVQGIGALVTAPVLWIGGPSDLGYGALYPVFAVLLPSVWLFAAGLRLWRRPAPVPVSSHDTVLDGARVLAGGRL